MGPYGCEMRHLHALEELPFEFLCRVKIAHPRVSQISVTKVSWDTTTYGSITTTSQELSDRGHRTRFHPKRTNVLPFIHPRSRNGVGETTPGYSTDSNLVRAKI